MDVLERIDVVGEDGYTNTLLVLQDYVVSRPLNGPMQRIPKRFRELKTLDGYAVNFVSDDEFDIVGIGIRDFTRVRRVKQSK